MGWRYIDPSDEEKHGSLPEIEVWSDLTIKVRCRKCGTFEGAEGVINADDDPRCPTCGKKTKVVEISCNYAWYYWFCVVGCLPSSDCFGPYTTEEAALAAARSFCDVE